MRPVREIPQAFFDVSEEPVDTYPLLQAFVASHRDRRPLSGFRLILVQHQLVDQVAMVDALIELGADPADMYWLDIPYTSNARIREHLVQNSNSIEAHFRTCADYRVLDAYEPYQHGRAVKVLLDLMSESASPCLVLDDGAYIVKALSAVSRSRWPGSIGIVEQTTRGIIKIDGSAAMRAVSQSLPMVDVAASEPKRKLEPPFIAMAVCASLDRALRPLLRGRPAGRALVCGYGAIGEQVATYLAAQFGIDKSRIYVHDRNSDRMDLARRRCFAVWDPSDLEQRFDLVIGCSGQASLRLGDRAYLADGALLASASSGAVELSRREFVELADACEFDDVEILREHLDERDLHANVDIRLVDRTATFVNAGFPVNFDGRAATIPARYFQVTPLLMTAAAVQSAEAVHDGRQGRLALADPLAGETEVRFRELLGAEAHYLEPPPEEAW